MRASQIDLSRSNYPAMNRPYSGLRPVRSILLRCVSIHAAASCPPYQSPRLEGIPYLGIIRGAAGRISRSSSASLL